MRKIILVLSLLASISLVAQDAIVTDRPTQSAASAVMPKGAALIEYGFIHENAGDISVTTFANVLARVGLFDGFEFRLSQNILQLNNDFDDSQINGVSPITIGTKVHVVGERGAMPQTSIIGQVTLSNGNEAFRPENPVPEVRLNFSNSLTEFLSLGYNVGMSFPEDDTQGLYTAVLGYSFSPGWTLFAEPYGFFGNGDADHRFNTGLIYLVSDNVQFDVSAGWGLSDISPDSFIGFGAAIGF